MPYPCHTPGGLFCAPYIVRICNTMPRAAKGSPEALAIGQKAAATKKTNKAIRDAGGVVIAKVRKPRAAKPRAAKGSPEALAIGQKSRETRAKKKLWAIYGAPPGEFPAAKARKPRAAKGSPEALAIAQKGAETRAKKKLWAIYGS